MSKPAPLPRPATASERLASLHAVAALLASLGGARARAVSDLSSIDGAYESWSTLAQLRFDELAIQAAAVASAGAEAVLARGEVSPVALTTLADAIQSEIVQLEALLAG